jgi:hypothetical protein
MERMTTMGSETNRQLLARSIARKRDIEAELREVEKDIKRYEDIVLEEFLAEGMTQAKVAGFTLYLHRQVWAKKLDDPSSDAVIQALEDAGLRSFLTFNSQTLSSWMRETLEAAGAEVPVDGEGGDLEVADALPDSFKGVIGAEQRVRVRARKA